FALWLGAFYALFFALMRFAGGWHDAYLAFIARVSGVVLSIFESGVVVQDNIILTGESMFSLRVVTGCDPLHPTLVFIAGVLAMPAPWKRRAIGALSGIVFLFALNIVRIVSLYFVGKHWPERFETAHLDVWQPLFMLAALLAWFLWARWALRPKKI
ncbi:MAG: exosortase H, partial [Planctomycetota bacterium]|nr:exosortase H [Planctomycetota bacterium]